MSESSVKGKTLERKIASILRSKLGVKVDRDKRSGAGINKSDINDYWRELPIFIEAKNQKTIKIKEFFRQAERGSSVGQAPTVVFDVDGEEVLACLRFSDLVNFLVEIKDYQTTIAELRQPIVVTAPRSSFPLKVTRGSKELTPGPVTCREGHLSDQFGYCNQLTCKYSRGYRPPKGKKK